MTEDEAFIRAVVDSPGDDLPRLVYADWLDERDDPRGAYLRAEAEWAKTKQTAGFLVLRLNGLAEGLDPVWVARVSRPPVGVCCDHLRFTNAGKLLTATQLVACAKRLKTAFPPNVLAFLSNHNGGRPKPCWFLPDLRSRRPIELVIDWFLTATAGSVRPRPEGVFCHDIETYMPILHGAVSSRRTDRQPWLDGIREYVPLAMEGHLGAIAVGLNGRRAELVYHINRPTLGTASPPRKIADSLPEFLACLRNHPDSP